MEEIQESCMGMEETQEFCMAHQDQVLFPQTEEVQETLDQWNQELLLTGIMEEIQEYCTVNQEDQELLSTAMEEIQEYFMDPAMEQHPQTTFHQQLEITRTLYF
uniref:Uncharacterized protein n=1 Tax=Cacopsylla melanoneura TaxID=428564 RepID=A0A8D8XCV0_9HEMI